MGSLEDLEQRVAAVGAELAVVCQEGAAARTLGALRETQLEHYAEYKADAAEVKAGIAQIVHLLEGLGGAAS